MGGEGAVCMATCTARPLPKLTWAAPLPAAEAPGGKRGRRQQGQQHGPASRPRSPLSSGPRRRSSSSSTRMARRSAPAGSWWLPCWRPRRWAAPGSWPSCAYLQACAELFSCCCSDTQKAGEPGWQGLRVRPGRGPGGRTWPPPRARADLAAAQDQGQGQGQPAWRIWRATWRQPLPASSPARWPACWSASPPGCPRSWCGQVAPLPEGQGRAAAAHRRAAGLAVCAGGLWRGAGRCRCAASAEGLKSALLDITCWRRWGALCWALIMLQAATPTWTVP
jgi:hypothetical protein